MRVSLLENKSDVLKNIKNLSIDKRYTFFTNGTLSSIDVFQALLDNMKEFKIKATICTWQLGIRDAEIIQNIIDKYNIDLKILLDVSYENRNPEYFKRVKSIIGRVVWLTKNHSKVMVVESETLKYCVLSSANFNKNIRNEFFDITESEKMTSYILDNLEPFFTGDPISKDIKTRSEINEKFNALYDDKGIDMVTINDTRMDINDLLRI